MNLITIIKYILLGAIQGFTEPIPVSSSAHMVILSDFFHINTTDLNFEIFIHFASFLAIALFLRKDIKSLISSLFKKETKPLATRYILHLIIASIPAGIVGFLFKDFIDENLNTLTTAAAFLLVTSFFLFLTSIFFNKAQKEELSLKDHFIIGFFQMLALIPGISRSGATLLGGTIQKGKVKSVLRFSFFLYLIASLGALILSLFDMNWATFNWPIYLISFISAFLATYIAIHWLYQIISKRSLMGFAIYTGVVGLIAIFLL